MQNVKRPWFEFHDLRPTPETFIAWVKLKISKMP